MEHTGSRTSGQVQLMPSPHGQKQRSIYRLRELAEIRDKLPVGAGIRLEILNEIINHELEELRNIQLEDL